MTDDQPGGALDALAAARVVAEDDYLAHVRDLEGRVANVLAAAAAAETAARTADEAPGEYEAAISILDPPEPRDAERQQPDQAPWPIGGGPVRALLNGFARWWLRDYLAVLDARHEALAERSRQLETDLDDTLAALLSRQAGLVASSAELSAALAELHRWTCSAWREQESRAELLRDGLNRVGEAIDLVSGASLRLRTLINAKNAETVQQVVGGVDRKAEVVLDALARRQEALLAELVGRRQELDDLVAKARSSD